MKWFSKTNANELYITSFMIITSIVGVVSSHFVFRNPPTLISFTSLSFGILVLSCLSWVAAFLKHDLVSRWILCLTMMLGFTAVVALDGYNYTGAPIAMTFIALVPAFFSGGKRALMSLILLTCLFIIFFVIGFMQYPTLKANGGEILTPIQLAFRYSVVFIAPLVHHIYERRMLQVSIA